MRPEKEVRLLWSKLTLRRQENKSAGDKSTILWERKAHLLLALVFKNPHFIILNFTSRMSPYGAGLQGEVGDFGVV